MFNTLNMGEMHLVPVCALVITHSFAFADDCRRVRPKYMKENEFACPPPGKLPFTM